MNIVDLKDKLNKDFNVVLISGNAGIGKTYWIKNYIKKKSYIYLSLFGLDSLEKVENYIIEKLLSKIEKKEKNYRYYESNSFMSEVFRNELSESLNNDLILVIDDLDKKSPSIDYREIFGLIKTISEIKNIKIILISNIDNIQEKEVFHNSCCSVVDNIYYIKHYSKEALSNITKEILNNISIDNILTEENYNNYLSNFLDKYKIKDLRLICKMILFSTKVLKLIDTTELSKDDLNIVTITSFATVVVKYNCLSTDYEFITKQIVSNYLDDIIYPVSREDLVLYILSLYDNEEVDINVFKINDYFNQISTINSTIQEKDLFFCSSEKIEKRIKKFIKMSIDKYNNRLTIDEWYNKLYDLYFYAHLIEKEDLLISDNIINIMDSYVDNIKCWEISLFNLILRMQHDTNKTDECLAIYKILKDKIVYKYFMYNYECSLNTIEKGIYDSKIIADLITFILGSDFKNMIDFDKAIHLLRNKNLFIPNLDGEIDEVIWNFVNEIWKGITSSDESQNKRKILNLLIEISNDMYQKTTSIGKFRITTLNEYYNILQI